MSKMTQDPIRHDFFVGLACRRLLDNLRGAKIVSLDGGIPFPDCVAPQPTTFLSYRPDAVIEHQGNFWVIEVKSQLDMSSKHTQMQLAAIKSLLDSDDRWNLYLVIFDCDDGLRVQRVLKRLFQHERALVESVIGSKGAENDQVHS